MEQNTARCPRATKTERDYKLEAFSAEIASLIISFGATYTECGVIFGGVAAKLEDANIVSGVVSCFI